MIWQTVREWEDVHNREYPSWAAVWSYDAYSEAWTSEIWRDVKDFYDKERTQKQGEAMWDFQCEPMVCSPTFIAPRWGDGTPLRRAALADEGKGER